MVHALIPEAEEMGLAKKAVELQEKAESYDDIAVKWVDFYEKKHPVVVH